MSTLDFGVEVIIVSASGVLAPGPLFFTNILYGTSQGVRSGLKIAYGHTIVELPLLLLISLGLFSSAAATLYSEMIGFVGGIGIIGFASMQIANVLMKRNNLHLTVGNRKSPFVAGIILSALNPFFLIWWFTVGLKLIADSATFGFVIGISFLFMAHIWMDYAWLISTAYLASKGSSIIKSKYYPILLLALAVALLYYGAHFILTAIGVV